MGIFHSKQSIKNQIKEEISLLGQNTDIKKLQKEIELNKFNYNHTLSKLSDENKYLNEVNLSLEKEIANLKSNISTDGGLSLTGLSTTELRLASEKNIDEYIQKILDNPDTNVNWMPDIVEKKIYKNIALIALNALETTIENSDIKFLGHRIKFVMDPDVKTDQK